MAVRVLFVVAAFGLAASIVWASGQAPLWDSVVRVAADPWGLVMLVDLYSGFLAAAALFFLVERPLVAIAMVLVMMLLGNIVTLLWLAVRGWQRLQAAR